MTSQKTEDPRGEFAKIEEIKKILGTETFSSGVEVGIGDDAAVVEGSGRLLLCTDAFVEGTHFDFSFIEPVELGHKALAATLSDIAAMNGKPRYLLLSIAVTPSAPSDFLNSFYRGARALCAKHSVSIVGGDLTSSQHGVFIDVVGVGQVEKPILRSGARPGDYIAVSGTPGASAAGLYSLQKYGRAQTSNSLRHAHLLPIPRFDLIAGLQSACTSLIDISDGLSSEVLHVARASKTGAHLEAKSFPIHPDALKLAHAEKIDPTHWALSGGEDYELLATLDASFVEKKGPPPGFTVIGRVTPPDEGVTITHQDGKRSPLVATGFNHFASS